MLPQESDIDLPTCSRFFAISISLVYLYHTFFHRVEEEEFGGLWEIVKEGMMTSFALFLVSAFLILPLHIILPSFSLADNMDHVLHSIAVWIAYLSFYHLL